ncbi:hypothetical protein E4U41_002587 [Claviceps citrina]|nr:hypothetical protein E4U41_002587 [Claviceps citrina]
MARPKSIKAPSKPKSQPARSQPVDPQELSRRLSVVLAEQRARADRKRRATTEAASKLTQHSSSSRPNRNADQKFSGGLDRAKPEIGITHKPQHSSSLEETSLSHLCSKKPGKSSTQDNQDEVKNKPTYRHVPKVAASQFTSTTTTESASEKGPIHALSRHAMRFHLDGPNASPEARANDPDAPPYEKNRALRRAQTMRERHYKRNPVDKPSLPITSQPDMSLYALGTCHIRQSSRSDKTVDDESRNARRMSTGSMLGRSEPHAAESFELAAVFLSADRPEIVGNPNDHRVDWTQSDERTGANIVVKPAPTQPELRKTESKWKLKGRLGNFGRHNKEDKLLTPPEELLAVGGPPKSPIAGFLSRFRR